MNEPTTNRSQMDLIRRSDAIASWRKHQPYMATFGMWRLKEDLEEIIPAVDAVEVVRCRECRHNGQPPDKGFAQCELDALIREPEFWCRAGQREDGDE